MIAEQAHELGRAPLRGARRLCSTLGDQMTMEHRDTPPPSTQRFGQRILAIVAVVTLLSPPGLSSAMDWVQRTEGISIELDEAQSTARSEGKDLLVLMTEWPGDGADGVTAYFGDGCPECIGLVDEAMGAPEVKREIEQSYVFVQLRSGWSTAYANITGSKQAVYPALFILSGDGVCLSETVPDEGGRSSRGKITARIKNFLQAHVEWRRRLGGTRLTPTQEDRMAHPFPCLTAFMPIPSDDMRFPRPDTRDWWKDKTHRTDADVQLQSAEEADVVGAFLAGASLNTVTGPNETKPQYRLSTVRIAQGIAAAIIDEVYDENCNEFMSYLACFASAESGSSVEEVKSRYRLVSMKTLAGSVGLPQIHRVELVETSHEARPLLYLYRAEGSHVMIVGHELYRMEKDGLKLIWSWTGDVYTSWGFPGQRGPSFFISNMDFSGLKMPANTIVVYSTLVEDGLARYEKTEIPWSGKDDAFLSPNQTLYRTGEKPPAGKH